MRAYTLRFPPGVPCFNPLAGARELAVLEVLEGVPNIRLYQRGAIYALTHWVDRDTTVHRWVLLPVEFTGLRALAEGNLTLRGLLDRTIEGRVYLLDYTEETVCRATVLPRAALPEPYVLARVNHPRTAWSTVPPALQVAPRIEPPTPDPWPRRRDLEKPREAE